MIFNFIFFKFNFNLLIIIILALLGLRCCAGFSLVVACRLLIVGASCCRALALGAWASVVPAPGPQSTGSIVVVHGSSCLPACGILLDQGSNLFFLHWQVDPLALSHQGSPWFSTLNKIFLHSLSLWFLRNMPASIPFMEETTLF